MSNISLKDAYIDKTRRDFLKRAGAGVTTLALASGVTLMAYPKPAAARKPEDAVDPSQRWGLLIDVNKCSEGCDACVTACPVNAITMNNQVTWATLSQEKIIAFYKDPKQSNDENIAR